jgi:hypothetical protein
MQFIPLALQLAGSVGSMIAGSRASSANQGAAKVESQQAIINAGIEERQSRRRAAQILAKQNAISSAAGVPADAGGSTLEIMLDSAQQAEEQNLVIRMGGQIKSNVAKYKGYIAAQKSIGDFAGGVAGIGSALALANKSSTLGDLWSKAGGTVGASSTWASTAPKNYSLWP